MHAAIANLHPAQRGWGKEFPHSPLLPPSHHLIGARLSPTRRHENLLITTKAQLPGKVGRAGEKMDLEDHAETTQHTAAGSYYNQVIAGGRHSTVYERLESEEDAVVRSFQSRPPQSPVASLWELTWPWVSGAHETNQTRCSQEALLTPQAGLAVLDLGLNSSLSIPLHVTLDNSFTLSEPLCPCL